jgi:hypothetical protein
VLAGGPGNWSTRTYSGGRNLGSTVDGKPLLVSNIKKLEDAMIVSSIACFFACIACIACFACFVAEWLEDAMILAWLHCLLADEVETMLLSSVTSLLMSCLPTLVRNINKSGDGMIVCLRACSQLAWLLVNMLADCLS